MGAMKQLLLEEQEREEIRARLNQAIADTKNSGEKPSAILIRELIIDECNELAQMLISKNSAYGNSALDPVRVFSRSDTVEQIRVRLDDKLSRLVRGSASGEDVERDISGYLILLRIAKRIDEAHDETLAHALSKDD